MSVAPGTRLGAYEVVSPIGAGGMGEVYRARDPRLGRDVAIKVLPPALSADRDRLARFEQEARAAAALNHPNILAVFDVGQQDGAPYIVSELLEGETLRDRLIGPLPVRKALHEAIQIAQGLAAAHEKGIVHRDLKPENVFVTSKGLVKILDFGLAKLTGETPGILSTSQSPTTPAVTHAGDVLGTVGYMAPEQVRGQPADHRADIFAFGVMLYEMLSGRRAFLRDTSAETMTAILNEAPADLPADRQIPPTLSLIVGHCMEKRPADRFQAASDLVFALNSVGPSADGTEVSSVPVQPERRPSRSRTPWLIAVALLVVAGILSVVTIGNLRRGAPAVLVTRLDIVTPPTGDPFSFALSPDGRSLVFVATSENRPALWLRSLDQPAARVLPGTAGGTSPFWAADNRAVGFFADGKVKRVNLDGGVSQAIADAPDARGGSWSGDGFILYTPSFGGGVYRVPAAGGPASAVITPDLPKYGSYRFPQVLPDGKHFLFFANLGTEPSAILLGALDGAPPKRLLESDSAAAFAPPNYVLRVNQGVLEARRLDLSRGALSDPMPIAQPVGADPTVFRGAFAVSSAGVLAHRLTSAARRQLMWFDRSGARLAVVGAPNEDNQLQPALAPDGVRVAVQRTTTGVPHTFLLDGKPQETAARLMEDPSPEGRPVWSPDGRAIVTIQGKQGVGLAVKSLDDRVERTLFASPAALNPSDWSSDGRLILYGRADAKSGWDLWAVPVAGDIKPFVVVQAPGDQAQGVFSPSMKWIAYDSNESGRSEVHLQPFQRTGERLVVSAGGGMFPRWRGDGKELFYVSPDGTLMSVALRESANGASLEPAAPVPLFRERIAGGGAPLPGGTYQYAAARDGKRFLLNVTTEEATASPITIVLNWTTLLK